MGKRLEELNLDDEALPNLGWDSYFELARLIEVRLGLDIDDDAAFSRFATAQEPRIIGRRPIDELSTRMAEKSEFERRERSGSRGEVRRMADVAANAKHRLGANLGSRIAARFHAVGLPTDLPELRSGPLSFRKPDDSK